MLNGTSFIAGVYFIMSLAFSFYICFSFMAITPTHANQAVDLTPDNSYNFIDNFSVAPLDKTATCSDDSYISQIPFSDNIVAGHNFRSAIFIVSSR